KSILRADIAQLSQEVDLLTAQVAQMQAVRPRRKCPVVVPDKFDGSLAQFPAFFGQWQLYMSLQPEDFSTDRDKVGFLISLLSGSAARCATPLLTQPNQVLDNYAEFCRQFQAMFEDPVRSQTANRRLRELKQGHGSLMDYIDSFRVVTQDVQWNEAALLDQFQEGLSLELLDKLTHTECPRTLQELMHLCLHIDARLQQRPVRRWTETASVPNKMAPLVEVPSEEPMQLGAACPHLTQAEKDRHRHDELCLYCGTATSVVAGNEYCLAYGGL
uniref:DUF4939 domain-containing protein n=1 Tax=Naja naja TaxID=35670 RepID=A0A8C7DSI4_NAJNA